MTLIKNILTGGLLLLLGSGIKAQTDTLAQRIVLIGDAGQLTDGRHPVVDAVRNLIPLDSKTTVLFLGDNLYKHGLPDAQATNYDKARAVLDSQVSIADNTPAKVYMIPGNHDWENGSRGGFDAIIRQQLYVDLLEKPNVKYFPEEGCPGPVEVKLDNNTVLILFDSQWWLHPYDKPEIESDCPCKTKDELVTQIKDIITRNPKKLVLIACHHPFKSFGPHGGYFTLKQHIFPFTDIKPQAYIPLPIIGSIYPISRSVFGTPQDLHHPTYTNMINEITDVVKASSQNVVFLAGHEHNLELIKDGGYNYVISGGGCKTNRVSHSKKSEFTTRATGFAVMEISTNKNVNITFYTVTDSVRKRYEGHLLNFSSVKEDKIAAAGKTISYADTTMAASQDFPPAWGLKKLFEGQNYRKEWSEPVSMKTFNIRKEKGGLTITGVGGGTHTQSLRLKDNTGKEWLLRSMKKNPVPAVPGSFRGTVAPNIGKELNSASHPYGALIIPGLTKPLGITAAEPQLFFVPDDSSLLDYRKDFANTVCLLEDRLNLYNGAKTKSSSELFDQMLKKNNHRPYEPGVLKARLLDMLIGDFDRHIGQWQWSVGDTGQGKIYYPIPRDRDQAFFYSSGLTMQLMGSRVMPFLKGFKKDIHNVDWLNYGAKDFDRIFLTSLDADAWTRSIREFTTILSDSVIRAAVKGLPPEIFSMDGENIISKLISRRNVMAVKGMDYYNFLSRKVNIIGSNLKEYFKVSNADGGLQVRVYARKGNDTGFIMYNRIFYSSVTKEIRLYGLNDDDLFEVEAGADSKIKLRIIGGRGNDTFDVKGHVESLLYDRTGDLNVVKNSQHARKRFSIYSADDSKNLLGFEYNSSSFPMITAGYSYDVGYFAGFGIAKRTQGFRNLPYATDQRLSFLYAFSNAYRFDYKGEFNHITRNIDLLLNAKYVNPALRNFFGLGNKTVATGDKFLDFYKIRYREVEAEALLRKRYFEKMQLSFGPHFYSYQNNYSDNKDNILGRLRGQDSANVFSKKNYLGGKVRLVFNNQNNELFPTRGILWDTEVMSLYGLNSNSRNYTRITSDMTIYASLREPARVIAVIKLGAGKILSDNFEYFQALNMRNHTYGYLNGFRKNRYVGRSSAYGSLELRVKLFDVNSYILPGPFGLTASYDVGRVWLRYEQSRTWHSAYGFGFYFVPYNHFVITGVAGFAEKERALNFSIGTKFNITY